MTQQTATEWAREHGKPFDWGTDLDNYSPVARQQAGGHGFTYEQAGETRILLEDSSQLKDARNSVYLIDNGRTVEPFYVAGWHPEQNHLILCPFPTNVDKAGNVKYREDNREPVNFDNWTLGPRRAYHLKVRGV